MIFLITSLFGAGPLWALIFGGLESGPWVGVLVDPAATGTASAQSSAGSPISSNAVRIRKTRRPLPRCVSRQLKDGAYKKRPWASAWVLIFPSDVRQVFVKQRRARVPVTSERLLEEMSPADRRDAAAEDLARAGGRSAEVQIVEYDPAWPAAYRAERERLAPLLAGAELHHFGSTAVTGLAAKPVIDMIALVEDLDAPIAALVERGGYQYPPAFNATLTHRRFLCYPTAAHRTHHLHLVDEPGELERRLRFRDRLRADPVLAGEYVALKRALAERYSDDREAYTEAKSEFVTRHTPRPTSP